MVYGSEKHNPGFANVSTDKASRLEAIVPLQVECHYNPLS
jgi:hypothetical protein